MKINKSYLEQLIIEQIQLMENNQSSRGFLQALLQIGYQWEQVLGFANWSMMRDVSPEEKSEIFRNFVKEKLNPFSGKYIFIKAKYGRGGGGPYSIPFNFAFGQIASFSLIDTENILINIDNIEATTPQSSSTQLTFSPRLKSVVPPTVNLKIDDLLFIQRRDIEIYDENGLLDISTSGGVQIRISDSSNILSVAQDMGVHIPSSDNEAIEFIREAVYDEEEIDIFYKQIFRNPNFYSSVVADYLENLENQLRATDN